MTADESRRAELASLRIDRESAASTRRRPRRWRAVLVATVLLAAALGAVRTLTGRVATVRIARATVTTARETGPVPILSGSGYVVTGDRYVSLGVRVPGRIDRYYVEEGQAVHKGDVLVQLDDRDYRATVARAEASLEQARANVALAEADLRRATALHTQGVISRQEYDVFRNKAEVTRATIRQLEADHDQARVNLEYTTLRAPTDGVVLAKLKEVGEIAVPGGFAGSGDLVRIANLTDMRAEVDVNEADLSRVRIGQAAEVTPDAYPDARYTAEVVKLYPQVDRQKGTLKVEVHIRVPDARLLPDMSARVTFLSDLAAAAGTDAPIVLVPLPALRRDDKGNGVVWTVDSDRAHKVVVESAGTVGDRVRITKGLRGSEEVVVSDIALADGQRVRVATAD